MKNLANFRQAVKLEKLKLDGLRFFHKRHSSAKTYAEDLSNITFHYLWENSPNSLCNI